ncbi:MAG: hypothetical protein JJT95_16895 [Pararhodobacter sp.]|nr:hypothetical protein [Pararhodobacter sp.]
MLLSTAEDLAIFTKELQKETDRGLPLVAAALIDELLSDTLRSFFIENSTHEKLLNGATAPIGTMSARVNLCHALGLIDDYEKSEAELIRKVRNRFAHARHGLSFGDDAIKGLCSSFSSPLPEGDAYPAHTPRFRLINATICIVLRLYHRADWVALERRNYKVWVEPDFTRWRSTEYEPPSKGEVVLGLHPQQVSPIRYRIKPEE